MDSERGNRLREVRELLRISQQYLADLLRVSQAAISQREKGITKISYEECERIERDEKLRVRAEWLWSGNGPMLVSQAIEVNEDSAPYAVSLAADITEVGITKRFVAFVKEYARLKSYTSREVASVFNATASHYSQMKDGGKHVTPAMLALGVLRMGMDANYVLAEKEYNAERIKALQSDLEDERENNRMLRLLINELRAKAGLGGVT